MGRKGRNRRSEAEVDDDAASTSTSNTLASVSELGSEALSNGDPWEDCIELLFEKRSSTREQALDTLNRLFMSGFMYDEADAKQSTLTGLFIGSIKRGGSSECALACKALGFMTLTLGPCEQTEGYWCEARTALQGVLESSKDFGAKAAALQSLALLCFIAAEEPSDTEELLSLMQKHWTSGRGPVVQAAALRAWSLLLTTAPSGLLDSDFIEASLGKLAKCLHSGSVDVRAAGGEAAALLYHCSGLAALDSDPAADGENGMSSQSAAQQLGMADIVDRMKDLAKNTGDASRRSRKDRAALRSTFKDLINVVEDGSQTESKTALSMIAEHPK
ncbi:hypothetical protein WJX84_006704 [Apatococcus fuscideae]|uniref:Interferon-related developmental regulator N-terminal domain-containing protein n=1 Tax=Apatococcus fuscideae TaxID=2026836 RepID=A0AAW1SCC1_9CHLO